MLTLVDSPRALSCFSSMAAVPWRVIGCINRSKIELHCEFGAKSVENCICIMSILTTHLFTCCAMSLSGSPQSTHSVHCRCAEDAQSHEGAQMSCGSSTDYCAPLADL